ncbi:hypothetical protein FPSE_10339, partial [Fusarium pseudograminearum CS3096]
LGFLNRVIRGIINILNILKVLYRYIRGFKS